MEICRHKSTQLGEYNSLSCNHNRVTINAETLFHGRAVVIYLTVFGVKTSSCADIVVETWHLELTQRPL